MLNKNVFKFKYGNYIIKLETNIIARQSTASVIASIGDTVVIVTLVCNDELNNDNQFLPLSVYYQEKFYSIGKIPGSFFRREGRSSDIEIIISRLIDRSIRPLFNKNILNEIQIVVNVISVDPQISADILSIIAVSAVLSISGIPNIEILGASKVGYINNKFVLNPTLSEMNISKLNLIIAGTESGITVIDSSSDVLEENIILNSIEFGYLEYLKVINNIKLFSSININKKIFNFDFSYLNNKISNDLKFHIDNFCINKIENIYSLFLSKNNRNKKLNIIKNDLLNDLIFCKYDFNENLVLKRFYKLEKNIVTFNLFNSGIRIDKRKKDDIRNIDIKIGFLPKRVHGSSLFTRGETQALVTVTLGTNKDAQNFNDLYLGDRLDKFIFHYNFPPYSVGEVGNIGVPKRREIGHGYLAKKGLLPILPDFNKFPYTIRIVSDILESNGSSSMASVCGASLSLIDAGVPIKNLVSGVAMGLFRHNKKNFILSDIIGDEDRLGDMDLKVIGTYNGITALQMDMKIKNIDINIIKYSLYKSKKARFYILDKMKEYIKNIKIKISPFAPKIFNIKVDVNKIKYIIGKRGCVIKKLTEDNNCLIEVEDNGIIKVICNKKTDINNVKKSIKNIVKDLEIGNIYKVKIIKIVDFGIFVLFDNGKESLLHKSEILKRNININLKFFKIGQFIFVKILNIDINTKKMRLSLYKY